MSYNPDQKAIPKLHSMRSPLSVQQDFVNGVDEKGRPLPSMTRQEFTDECDINRIMANYEKNGIWPEQMRREPVYYDFVGMPDLREHLDAMYAADEAFMRLPASVRKEFDNDALRFVEYAQDPKNNEQMQAWGLCEPAKPEPAPIAVRVTNQDNDPKPAPKPGAKAVEAGD